MRLASRFRWPALDGLRAVAVTLVMVGHYAHVTIVGSLGVEMFYVISGFLITWLLLEDYNATGTIDKRAFWLRRTLRIFPAFYGFLIVNALVLAGTAAMPRAAFWAAAGTYTANYYVATHVEPSGALTHTWSLAVEEQFYLVWPLLLTVLLRGGRRTASLLLIGAMAFISVWRCFLAWVVGVPAHYLQFALDTRADFLAVGALVALNWGTPGTRLLAMRLTRRRWLAWLSIAVLAAVAVTFGRARAFEVSFAVNVLVFGAFLLQVLTLGGLSGWGFLDKPVMRWLGAISYSLYLYHYLAWIVVGWLVSDPLTRGILGAVLAVPTAALSYYGVERPFLRLRERIQPAVAPEKETGRSASIGPGPVAV
jgi:peptidoglycan/LPS O-acetylase OafA/YrhL